MQYYYWMIDGYMSRLREYGRTDLSDVVECTECDLGFEGVKDADTLFGGRLYLTFCDELRGDDIVCLVEVKFRGFVGRVLKEWQKIGYLYGRCLLLPRLRESRSVRADRTPPTLRDHNYEK